MIDLGAWASERYRVETHETPDASERRNDASRDDS